MMSEPDQNTEQLEGVEEDAVSTVEVEADEPTELEESADPENPLTEESIGEGISLLCKTGDGMAHAYVRLDVHDRGLTDISILNNFIHLRYLDLSKNSLRELSPVNALTHCITLKADDNKLNVVGLEPLPYLQAASFVRNRLINTKGVNHPMIEHLNLNYNRIEDLSDLNPSILIKLHTLELRGNKLTSTAGLNLPNLKNLFLAGNQLKCLEGLERLEHLATLHIRDNRIDNLDGFSNTMKNLQYINLRGNGVTGYADVKKLHVLPNLRALVLSENPIADEDDYRMEVLIALRAIERLDKPEYTDDERQEAEEMYQQRRQEELIKDGTQEIIPSDDEEAES